jgi:hypothetical protein
MPRIKTKCNGEGLSKRCESLRRFVPCFFDVPHKHVLEIVGVSHHTLDPIRRSLSLESWPYGEVRRGKFCMSRARIIALRAQAMGAADEEMQRILMRVAAKAEECWAGLGEPVQKRGLNCEESKRGRELCEVVVPPVQPPEPLAVDAPADPAWDADGSLAFWDNAPAEDSEERAFWDGICELLQLREAVGPPEPLSDQ